MGPVCVASHRLLKMSASHQLVPLHDALKGKVEVKRVPRCQRHIGYEINTFCKTCTEAICANCLSEKHSGHTFCPLSQVTDPLQDQIAGYTVSITKREEEAKKAVAALDGTITQIEERQSTGEKDVAKIFDAVMASVEERRVQVLQQIQDEVDQLRKTAIQEKGEAESARAEFMGFHSFTAGLLAQGTPLEIAGTHKTVRASYICLSF